MNCPCIASFVAVGALIVVLGIVLAIFMNRGPNVNYYIDSSTYNDPVKYSTPAPEPANDSVQKEFFPPRQNPSWIEIGKLLTESGRTLLLEEKVHERHKQRFMYRARSTDLNTATSFEVHIDGINTTDPYSKGSEQLYGGNAFLPEIGETARIYVTRP